MSLLSLTQAFVEALRPLPFAAPVAYTLQPLEYAEPVHRALIERYGQGRKRVLLLGMNPGPHGMGQTGVPFGDPQVVRDYLGLRGEVRQPEPDHPKHRVLGLASPRREVSGERLWGAIAARHADPHTFFAEAWVHPFSPLLFLDEGGRNVAADKLRRPEREAMECVCDAHLRALCTHFGTRHVIAIGQYAEACARRALGESTPITRILHPSPASPLANHGWAAQARATLQRAGEADLL